jgi:hypothetical protein
VLAYFLQLLKDLLSEQSSNCRLSTSKEKVCKCQLNRPDEEREKGSLPLYSEAEA